MDQASLEQALLNAHAQNDTRALIELYTIAGDQAEDARDDEAASFYLTHAFVFALEAGAPEAPKLNIRLANKGRAHLLEF